ncbi:MAG: hypothetical protein JRH20_01700 [Deltaproteobacteria bacterium]|nr:hypothetical protein [Deltaproteobacteria bacterium]
MFCLRGLATTTIFALALGGAACSDSDDGADPKEDSAVVLSDGGTVATSLTCEGDCIDYVFNNLMLPVTGPQVTEFGMDFSDDGIVDNALGSIISILGQVSSSMDVQPTVDESVWGGSALVLLRVKASDLTNQASIAAQAWLGESVECCTDPTDLVACKAEADAGCFKGDYSYTPIPESAALFNGAIANGTLELGPGSLQIKLPLAGDTPLDLKLKAVRIKAKITADGLMEGVLAGVIDKNDLDNTVMPSLAEMLDGMLTTGTAEAQETIKGLFDINPTDGKITTEELQSNEMISTFLSGDVDVDNDGVAELSLGIGFTGVKAVIADAQ